MRAEVVASEDGREDNSAVRTAGELDVVAHIAVHAERPDMMIVALSTLPRKQLRSSQAWP